MAPLPHPEPGAPAPRGTAWWRRPVGLRALLWVVGVLTLVWTALMVAGVWTFYEHGQVQVALRDQPLELRLPAGLKALATVDEAVSVPLRVSPKVKFHLDQTMSARLNQDILAHVGVHSVLPIDTVVPVKMNVPIQTVLHMRVTVRQGLPPVDVDLPVSLTVPVDWQIPVKARVPLDMKVLVSGHLQRELAVPVLGDWQLQPRIDTTLQAHLQGQTVFILQSEVKGMPVLIERADLRLPFDLRLLPSR
jgi:hypothetical protein